MYRTARLHNLSGAVKSVFARPLSRRLALRSVGMAGQNLHAAADNVIPRRRKIVILVVWGVLREVHAADLVIPAYGKCSYLDVVHVPGPAPLGVRAGLIMTIGSRANS